MKHILAVIVFLASSGTTFAQSTPAINSPAYWQMMANTVPAATPADIFIGSDEYNRMMHIGQYAPIAPAVDNTAVVNAMMARMGIAIPAGMPSPLVTGIQNMNRALTSFSAARSSSSACIVGASNTTRCPAVSPGGMAGLSWSFTVTACTTNTIGSCSNGQSGISKSQCRQAVCGQSTPVNPPVNPPSSGGTVCPMDMKQCPDGSWVGRNYSNNCNYYACPVSVPPPYQCSSKNCPAPFSCQNNRCMTPINDLPPLSPLAPGECRANDLSQCNSGEKCDMGCHPVFQPNDKGKCVPRSQVIPACWVRCLSSASVIATPTGNRPVTELAVGDVVWTRDGAGQRVVRSITRVSRIPAPNHRVVHLVLKDGRTLHLSAPHPTADGRTAGDLKAGDAYDNSVIASAELKKYEGSATYDILPAGDTGFYWANGILMGSTLK